MADRRSATMTIVTSVPPLAEGRLASLVPAVLKSWEDNGLSAVTVNWPGEVERVKSLYPSLDAIAVPGDLPAVFPDRYGPPLGALFGVARAHSVLGICNADVSMLKSDIRACVRIRPDTFLAARRLDVERLGGDVVGVYRRGVDAVFFDAGRYSALLEDENLARFQIGAPFWDILMPILASFHGPVSFIDPPFIIHPVHEARWSDEDYEVLRQLAIITVLRHAERHAAARPLARAFVKLFNRHVGDRVELPNRRARRNAMTIFNLWLAKLEQGRTVRLTVEVSGELSSSAIASLGRQLPDTPGATDVAGALAEGNMVRRLRQWTKTRLREWKRRRRERLIVTHLGDVTF